MREFDAAAVGRWSLDLRQFRSTASSTEIASRSNVAAPGFLQILNLSTKAGLQEVTITTTIETQPPVTVAIPNGQTESFLQLVFAKLGGLWTPRPPLQVLGSVYDLGDVSIRVGELRQLGSQTAPKGLILMIEEEENTSERDKETSADRASATTAKVANGEFSTARDKLQGIWNRLHIEGAKEFVREGTRDADAAKFDEAQLFCEALRLRS